MSINERIRQVMEAEAGGVQRRFATAIGVPHYTVHRVVTEGREVTAAFVASVLRAYPRVNPWWLLLGEVPPPAPAPPDRSAMYSAASPLATKQSA